jgi:ABC-type amino acid transport substrate-binding protein
LEFVNRVIREMKANGKLRQLQEQYFLIPAERTTKPQGFTSEL